MSRRGELLMRQSGIVALHAVTTTNALAFAFQTCGDDETRRLLMLQNAAFLTMFREAMQSRGNVKDVAIDELLAARNEEQPPNVDEIFATIGSNPSQAARQVVGYLHETGDAEQLIDAARVLVFLKGNDAHDYKFSSAVLEDYYHVSPQWRDVYLASNVYKLQSSTSKDNSLVERTRAAFSS